jgi:hypothetical protein
VKDGRAATYENRLATPSDFVMVVGKDDSLPPDLGQKASAMEAAITNAVSGGNVDYKDVSEIGATCAVLMGY